MTFTNMSPAQAADKLAWGDSSKFPVSHERDILSAIHHFSNKNLVAARRYAYVRDVLFDNPWFKVAEEMFPDA